MVSIGCYLRFLKGQLGVLVPGRPYGADSLGSVDARSRSASLSRSLYAIQDLSIAAGSLRQGARMPRSGVVFSLNPMLIEPNTANTNHQPFTPTPSKKDQVRLH